MSTIFQKQAIDFCFFDAVTPATMEQIANALGLDITKTDLAKSEVARGGPTCLNN